MESCRIDVDITEQQKRDGEWIPLLSASRPSAVSDDLSRKADDPPALSPTKHEAYDRHMRVRAHAGNLLQGWAGTFKSVVGFEGAKDCFDAVAIYRIDQVGVTLLFPAGLAGELNRFFIERVDFRCGPQHALSFAWLLPRWAYDQRVHLARWRLDSAPHRATKNQAEP